jgi:excinuclease ABC subunit C
MDAIAMAEGQDQAWVEVFFIRQGKLIGRDHFIMEGTQDDSPGHVLEEFIKQFYQSAPYIPPRLILQYPLEDGNLIQEWLKERRGGAVSVVRPQRGEQHKLIKMVAENAAQGLTQSQAKWLSNADAVQQAMAELQEELNLPNPPRRIECYDISNIQGTNAVGSMVTFQNGAPKPAHYRRFKIKAVEGINDYAMMQEVLRRRFKRMAGLKSKINDKDKNEGREEGGAPPGSEENWDIIPDLVLIDGGKGHLSASLEVFLEMGIDFIPLASLAKENEWLFVPQTPEPIALPSNSQALYLVQRVRDEAHRFAITYHRKLRSKASVSSSIDLVSGIGPKRKRMLMRRFGSLKGIKDATIDDIAAVPGMTRSLAVRLKECL